MSEREWRSGLEMAAVGRVRLVTEIPYVAGEAEQGLAAPTQSPSAIVTVESWKALEQASIAAVSYVWGEAGLFVNIAIQSSDPISGSGRFGVGGLRELAEKVRKKLQGFSPDLSAFIPDGVGAVGPLDFREESLYQVDDRLEIEQQWALMFQLRGVASV